MDLQKSAGALRARAKIICKYQDESQHNLQIGVTTGDPLYTNKTQ